MSKRHEQQAEWVRRADADREYFRAKLESAQRRFSPYRAVDGCNHAAIVERTCDHRHPPFLTDEGRVDCHVVVRARLFECAACGVGVWPASDSVRANAPRRPRCTTPECDCLSNGVAS